MEIFFVDLVDFFGGEGEGLAGALGKQASEEAPREGKRDSRSG